MARTISHEAWVSVEVDPREVLSEMDDDDLRKECVRRGILAKSEEPDSRQESISLSGNEMAEIADVIRYGDLEGAMMRLERLLPRDFRVFSDKLAGARPQ